MNILFPTSEHKKHFNLLGYIRKLFSRSYCIRCSTHSNLNHSRDFYGNKVCLCDDCLNKMKEVLEDVESKD